MISIRRSHAASASVRPARHPRATPHRPNNKKILPTPTPISPYPCAPVSIPAPTRPLCRCPTHSSNLRHPIPKTPTATNYKTNPPCTPCHNHRTRKNHKTNPSHNPPPANQFLSPRQTRPQSRLRFRELATSHPLRLALRHFTKRTHRAPPFFLHPSSFILCHSPTSGANPRRSVFSVIVRGHVNCSR